MGGYFEADIRLENHQVVRCSKCHQRIAFLVSKRTGNKYPVEVHQMEGSWYCSKSEFHDCGERT